MEEETLEQPTFDSDDDDDDPEEESMRMPVANDPRNARQDLQPRFDLFFRLYEEAFQLDPVNCPSIEPIYELLEQTIAQLRQHLVLQDQFNHHHHQQQQQPSKGVHSSNKKKNLKEKRQTKRKRTYASDL